MAAVILLIVVALAFAWNLGVHYTGAVMGMPYAARAIALWPALILIAVLTILGATFASAGVEATVGQHIINDRLVRVPDAIVYEQQQGRCAYTGIELIPGLTASLDHIIPTSRGGTHDESNLQWVTKQINCMKTDMTHDEFLAMCQLILNRAT
jgi:hypothetical protein